jgi:hypothetical protein
MVGYLRAGPLVHPQVAGADRAGCIRQAASTAEAGTLYASALMPPLGKLAQFLAYLRW